MQHIAANCQHFNTIPHPIAEHNNRLCLQCLGSALTSHKQDFNMLKTPIGSMLTAHYQHFITLKNFST